MMEQIDRLLEKLGRIRGNDALSRARRASIRKRILELQEQLREAEVRK